MRAALETQSAGWPRALRCAAAALLLSACASTSHELVGTPRTAIPESQVQLYLEPPAKPYVEIAVLATSSKHSLSLTLQGKDDVVIRRLKQEAAKLGANGVLLREISDEPPMAVGARAGGEIWSARGTVDLGVGASGLWSQRFGRGIAIYLESDGTPRQ